MLVAICRVLWGQLVKQHIHGQHYEDEEEDKHQQTLRFGAMWSDLVHLDHNQLHTFDVGI